MTTTATVSLPTSEIQFLDQKGVEIGTPTEWTPAFIALPAELEELGSVSVLVNGRAVDVSVRQFGKAGRVVGSWDRAGPGWYDIRIQVGTEVLTGQVRIAPRKISQEALAYMLEDLETRLPVAVAVALRDQGAHIGLQMGDVAPQTLATEVARVRRAIMGGGGRPGLVAVLETLARDPHRILVNVGTWVRRERARRPDPNALVQALWRAGNLVEGRLEQVLDRRVEHTADVYENRLLRSFTDEVERHLLRLNGVLAENDWFADLFAEVQEMSAAMRRARRAASFLSEARPLTGNADHVTMVLLRRKEYRAAYEGFLEFRRRTHVRLDDPLLAGPLENLPGLYQTWGTLLVIESVIHAAGAHGFNVAEQTLVWPQAGGLYLRVLRNNKAAVVMRDESGDRLTVYPERSYRRKSGKLRSVSFTQRPDVAIELTRAGQVPEVYLFDPKYKLDSEEGADPGDGTPKKVDIDKMHAIRDAIRTKDGARLVHYAATLYPGESRDYGDGLSALRMYPGEEEGLQRQINRVLDRWLGTV